MATTQHVTICRLCPAFCGMIVEVEGERVIKSRGDPLHPMSRGYLCPKGRSAGAFHHHPRRLGRPLIGGQATTWEQALDAIADRVRSIVEKHGANGVGFYNGSGGA